MKFCLLLICTTHRRAWVMCAWHAHLACHFSQDTIVACISIKTVWVRFLIVRMLFVSVKVKFGDFSCLLFIVMGCLDVDKRGDAHCPSTSLEIRYPM